MFGKRLSRALALTVTATLVMAAAAFADQAQVDLDTDTGGVQHSVLVSAAPGGTVNTGAEIAVNWQGSKHLLAGSSISFTNNAAQTNLPAGYTVGDAVGSVPTGTLWDGNTDVFSVASAISFTAPAAPGEYSYTVKYDVGSFTCVAGTNPVGSCLNVVGSEFTINLTVTAPTNAAPVISSASFSAASVDCRVGETLTVAFTDATSTSWSAEIDWDYDGTNFTATPETVAPVSPPSFTANHTYNLPGTYTAAVRVTDNQGLTSAVATDSITVNQTYTIDFLPPFDDSTPSGLIVNKMKNGRVVPVKVTLFDDCALAAVTDPNADVTIFVSKTSGSGTGDPVEEYADAGASSAGTNEFRWADGFWIYNLDSKALGLVVNNLYRIDVYVGAVKATVDNWAVLQPVK